MSDFRAIGSFAKQLKRVNESNSSGADVYSVTKYDGFVRSLDYFKKQVFSRDLSSYKIVRKGEFAYSTIHLDEGALGLLADEEALISPMYTTFEVDASVERQYLAYLLKSPNLINQYGLIGQGSVNRRKSVPFSSLAELEVFIPPLPEQKKIAEILSGIDRAIKAISIKAEKVDQILRQATIEATNPTHQCQWRITTIGEVITFQGGAQPPRSTFKFAPAKGYIRMLQIRDYKSDSRATYIPLEHCKRFCQQDDVMIGRYGPPNFQILRGKEGSYNVALIKAMPREDQELSKEYLYRFLNRQDLFSLMDTLSQRTSGQQGLDMDALKSYGMFLPELSVQNHICKSLRDIEAICLNLKEKVESLKILKSGVSFELLSGRKRVNV